MDMEPVSVKRIIRFQGNGPLKAFADLAIGQLFLIKGLRVVEGKNGLFVSMPRQQGKDAKWYDSVETLDRQIRREVERIVLEAYEQESDGNVH